MALDSLFAAGWGRANPPLSPALLQQIITAVLCQSLCFVGNQDRMLSSASFSFLLKKEGKKARQVSRGSSVPALHFPRTCYSNGTSSCLHFLALSETDRMNRAYCFQYAQLICWFSKQGVRRRLRHWSYR